MLIVLFAILLFLGIAFFQTVQGTYSAAVMAVLTTVCAALALNYYYPLADLTLMTSQPAYAQGLALMVLFVVPLLVLRLLADRFMSGNVVLGAWADRAAGAILGMYISAIIVGVFMTAIQMFPWSGSVMGYRPFDDKLQRVQRVYFDEFAVGLANMLSSGSLADDPPAPIAANADDFLRALYCAHNDGTGGTDNATPLAGQVQATPGSASAAGAWLPPQRSDLPRWQSDVPHDPMLTASQNEQSKIVIVRYYLYDLTGSSEITLADPDSVLRLAGTQFRMITSEGRSVYPVAYLTYLSTTEPEFKSREDKVSWMLEPAPVVDEGPGLIGRLAAVRPLSDLRRNKEPVDGKKILTAVDWVYRLNEKETPRAFVFRNIARGAIAKEVDGMPSGDVALARKKS